MDLISKRSLVSAMLLPVSIPSYLSPRRRFKLFSETTTTTEVVQETEIIDTTTTHVLPAEFSLPQPSKAATAVAAAVAVPLSPSSPPLPQRSLVIEEGRQAGDSLGYFGMAEAVVCRETGISTPSSTTSSLASSSSLAPRVDWKFGRLGIQLLLLAQQESQRSIPQTSNDVLERKAFLDSLSYLLRALPSDLDDTEVRNLLASLPDDAMQYVRQVENSNRNSSDYAQGNGGGLFLTYSQQQQQQQQQQDGASILHRAVHVAVVNTFVVAHKLAPYAVTAVRAAVRAERRYKVSESVVGQGMELANALGRRSVLATTTVCNMAEGRVGRALTAGAAWFIDGVSRGVADGVGEGMAIVTKG